MKNKKIIIIILSILLIVIASVILIISLNSNKNEEFVDSEKSNWDRKVFLPVKIKVDSSDKLASLYIKNKLVDFGTTYENFEAFINVSKNNIALNAVSNNSKDKTLYIVNLDGKVKSNITEMLIDETNKNYSGSFDFTNDHLELYYVDKDICENFNSNVDKLYVKTRNDVIEYVKKEQVTRSDFFAINSNYC